LEACDEGDCGVVPIVPVVIVPVLTEHWRVDSMLLSFGGRIKTLCVIDNANSEWQLRTHKALDVFVWRMPSNLGVSASWNLGIKATPFSPGWMIVNHDIQFGDGAVAEFYGKCRPDNIVLGGKPNWSCVWIGSEVVAKVGLFHEGFHPAYFEDNDYEVRAQRAGVEIVQSTAAINHRNSSTLASSEKFQQRNAHTFQANLDLFNARLNEPWEGLVDWDLSRRRELGWD
jgi:GT2 family glycosyltransferase